MSDELRDWKSGDHGWYWHTLAGKPRRIYFVVRNVSEDRLLARVQLVTVGLITVRTVAYSRLRRMDGDVPERYLFDAHQIALIGE